jgi:hypothetical protein
MRIRRFAIGRSSIYSTGQPTAPRRKRHALPYRAVRRSPGYWLNRDYDLPKHEGTFWVLSMLGDTGMTSADERIRRACGFMFTYQHDDGAFRRRSRVADKGLVRRDAGPCTHARIVRFLIQVGCGGDIRTRRAVDWLLAAQHVDGMWNCGGSRRYGCLRATLDALRVVRAATEGRK